MWFYIHGHHWQKLLHSLSIYRCMYTFPWSLNSTGMFACEYGLLHHCILWMSDAAAFIRAAVVLFSKVNLGHSRVA